MPSNPVSLVSSLRPSRPRRFNDFLLEQLESLNVDFFHFDCRKIEKWNQGDQRSASSISAMCGRWR